MITEAETIIGSPFSKTVREAMTISKDGDLDIPESIEKFARALLEVAKERRVNEAIATRETFGA